MLVAFILSIYFALSAGDILSRGDLSLTEVGVDMARSFELFSNSVYHHVHSTIGMLLMQILVILSIARLFGWFFTKIGQPSVIGEIIAGILLGPTLLGKVSPVTFNFLFPADSLDNISLLSNFGLILFMFVIGMELRIVDIKKRLSQSIIISHTGIFLPFALSLIVSYYIYKEYASNLTGFIPFALFIGISMSITAFPVLARIIQENNLSRKPLGKLALSSAASGDITAWVVLAAIIAIAENGNFTSTLYNILFLIAYLLIMFGVIRPLFKVAGKIYDNTEVINHTLIGVIFVLLLLSSYVTELLSMHALFGAFIFGLVMPEDLSFRKIVTDKIEDVSIMIFLPLFFVSSGLQTELGLIHGIDMWILLGVFTAIAVFGKVFGTYISARVTGENPRNSLYLGAFMNTRGLMELVVLSIGFNLKVLPPSIFAVLVLMTIITTVMTMPMVSLISWIFRLKDKKKHGIEILDKSQGLKVLISFGRPQTGARLLKLSSGILNKGIHNANYTALHITTDLDVNSIDAEKYFKDDFAPIDNIANSIKQTVCYDYILAANVEDTIVSKLKQERYNLLIVGGGISSSADNKDKEATNVRENIKKHIGSFFLNTGENILSVGGMIHDKTDYFFKYSPCSVGVFLSREDVVNPKQILFIVDQTSDLKILPYVKTLGTTNSSKIIITAMKGSSLSMGDLLQYNIQETTAFDDLIKCSDFLFLSYSSWTRHFDKEKNMVRQLPSTLIMNIKENN